MVPCQGSFNHYLLGTRESQMGFNMLPLPNPLRRSLENSLRYDNASPFEARGTRRATSSTDLVAP